MILSNEISIVGKFNKPHGINGEISATFDIPLIPENLKFIIADIDGIFVPFFIENIRPKNQSTLLLKFEGFDDEIQVSELSNKDIYLKKSDIPDFEDDEDGIYASDLIDYTILTSDNHTIGKITNIDDSTENVLFIIENNSGKTMYIPVVDEFIININNEELTITMDLPDGILEINN